MACGLLVLLAVGAALAQQKTLVFTFSGGLPNCANCGAPSQYACNGLDIGNWHNGTFTFDDPVPAGSKVTQALLWFQGAYGCNGTSGVQFTAYLQGTEISTVSASGTELCACNSCDGQRGVCRSSEYLGWPNYNYGGTNSVALVLDGIACLNEVSLTITYAALTPLPPMTVYVDVAPGMLIQNNPYPPSMGQCIMYDASSEGAAGSFTFTFQDPVPKGAVVITFSFRFYGAICDSAQFGQEATFPAYVGMASVNDMTTNYTSTWDLKCGHLVCTKSMEVSRTYQFGWPGYAYGSQNEATLTFENSQMGLAPLACITRGEIFLTYYTPPAPPPPPPPSTTGGARA